MGRSPVLAAAAIAALLTLGASEALAFSCVRHFVNRAGSCSWTVKARAERGNVYFKHASCIQGRRPVVQGGKGGVDCVERNGPCVVPAYCVITMEFTYNKGRTNGSLDITDANNKTHSFNYDTSRGVNQCPYIFHSGNTGGASVNDPANGDVQAWQCSW
jgi:hypothetical protein